MFIFSFFGSLFNNTSVLILFVIFSIKYVILSIFKLCFDALLVCCKWRSHRSTSEFFFNPFALICNNWLLWNLAIFSGSLSLNTEICISGVLETELVVLFMQVFLYLTVFECISVTLGIIAHVKASVLNDQIILKSILINLRNIALTEMCTTFNVHCCSLWVSSNVICFLIDHLFWGQ